MSAVNLAKQEWTKSNFQDYIVPKYITAPFTTIQNRAQVLDASNMLQAVMGVERVPFKGINLLQNEFGPNGEQVWELESKDARVRFVGSGWVSLNDSNGNRPYIVSGTTGEYLEVSFFGTGLNILELAGSGRGFLPTIDGGAEGANILPDVTAVLNSRNYNANTVYPVASGLSLGQHTIRIRRSVSSFATNLFGIEVLNQSTSIAIPAGQAFIGNKKESLNALTTSAYNAGVVGTKGARVVKYLKDGIISQAVTEVPATPSYLTNANHANEEVVRKINFREFGANRTDDFSQSPSGAGQSKAFTLDDGTTTLVLSNGLLTNGGVMQAIWSDAAGAFYTITFVGTGLDIDCLSDVNGPRAVTVSVDGSSSVGTITRAISSNAVTSVCSGLPYGTHTVKFTVSGAYGLMIRDFIIYQPKKPTLPVGAIEVADYNVMADYVNKANPSNVSAGVLRKMACREFTYVGTFNAPLIEPPSQAGIVVGFSTANSYYEYSFFGTGIDLNQYHNTGTASTFMTISIDGSSNLSGATTSAYGSSLISFVASTGVLNLNNTTGNNVVSIRGLSLSQHKIRITFNSGGTTYVNALDVITPIHINHPTLKIGSLSLLDNAKVQALALPVSGPDLSKAKAWLVYDGVNSKILASHNISQVLKVATGAYRFYFSKSFKTSNYVSVGGSTGSIAASFAFDYRDQQKSATSMAIGCVGHDGGYRDQEVCVVLFGELVDE